MPIMPWHGPPRAKGAPVAAGIIFHTSISLVTVTMFVRCFPKISTSNSFPDLAGILHSAFRSHFIIVEVDVEQCH